jgi:putative endonuclease
MTPDRSYYVYMMANKANAVLYTGVTNDLVRRAYEHRESLVDGFSARYHCTKLVYYEVLVGPVEAITREKQIKAGSRQRKNDLVNAMNPEWKDLSGGL